MFVPAKAAEAERLLKDVRSIFSARSWDFSEIYIEKGRLDEVFRIITTNDTGEVEK